MKLGVVIRKVGGSGGPVYLELTLIASILQPIKTYVDGFRSFLFDCVVKKSDCRGVVYADWRGWLFMSEFV